jgi:hypothetical protein
MSLASALVLKSGRKQRVPVLVQTAKRHMAVAAA